MGTLCTAGYMIKNPVGPSCPAGEHAEQDSSTQDISVGTTMFYGKSTVHKVDHVVCCEAIDPQKFFANIHKNFQVRITNSTCMSWFHLFMHFLF